MSATRTRNFVTIVYPESAPTNWREVLAETCVPAIVSPLHDKDVNPDGEPKKAHWHVMLMFPGVKTIEQVTGVCKKFGGIKPQTVSSVQGQARYLVHKDNPEKAQYNPGEIECFSGADWSEIVKTSRDRYDTLEDIIAFMDERKMFSYYDLVNYCRLNNRQWFEVVCDNTVLLKGLCQSGEWTMEQRQQRNMHNVREPYSISDRPV